MDVQQKIVTAALAIVLIFVVNSAYATGGGTEKNPQYNSGGSSYDLQEGNPGYTEDQYNDDSGDINMKPPQEYPAWDGNGMEWDYAYESEWNQEY